MKDYEEYVKSTIGKKDIRDEIIGIEPYARMATEGEFTTKLLRVANTEINVPPGLVMFQDSESSFVRTEMNHVLLSGPTGTGKSVTALCQVGRYWARTMHPIVWADPKGELLALNGQYFKDAGYEVQVIYLKDPTKGIRVNPFAEINKKLQSDNPKIKEEGELELADLLYSMIVEGTPTSDMYWTNNPWQFACGLTKELVSRAGNKVEITIPMIKVAADMIVSSKKNLQEFRDSLSDDDPYLPEMLNMLSVTADDTRSGMAGHLQLGFSFCKSRGMIDMLSGNDLDIHAIASGKPIALFIVSPDNTNIYDSLVSVILGQMIHTMYSDADTIYGGALPKDVLFVLDEFSNIPKIPAFEKVITTARSRRLRFIISVQSINQLYSRYGSSADTIIDNCKDWICTAADPVFSRRLNEKLGQNAAGKEVITHNTLRCLPPGRPLVVLDRSNPFITTLFMVEKPTEKFNVESRALMKMESVDLEALVFDPDQWNSVSMGDKTETCLDDFDFFYDEPVDWTQSQEEFHGKIVECNDHFNLMSSIISDENALRTALLMHCLAEGTYTGQAIRVKALMKFQSALDMELEFGELMELVSILINDDDYEESAATLIETNKVVKGVKKSTLTKIIRDLCKELGYLKTDENIDSSLDDKGTPTDNLKIINPLGLHAVEVINGSLDGIVPEEVDVKELSYTILEALIREYITKAKIMEHKEDYEQIIPLYNQLVVEAFNEAMEMVEVLSEAQVKEILEIINS